MYVCVYVCMYVRSEEVRLFAFCHAERERESNQVPVVLQFAAFHGILCALRYVVSKTCIKLDMGESEKKVGHWWVSNTVPLDLKVNAVAKRAIVTLQLV